MTPSLRHTTQTVLVVCFKSYKVTNSADRVEYAGKAPVVGISQTNRPPFLGAIRRQETPQL